MHGLEICSTGSFDDCQRCPYVKHTNCQDVMGCDALALLKEQEKQLKEWEKHVPFLAAHGLLKGEEEDA